MKMKHPTLKRAGAIFLACVTMITTTGADFIRDREPNWYIYTSGQRFPSLPQRAPTLTGFYSSAISTHTDFSQTREDFTRDVLQYTADSFVEVFWELGRTTPVTYVTELDPDINLNRFRTGVPAFDSFNRERRSTFPIDRGQWLVNNGIFSRFNDYIQIIPSESEDGGVGNISFAPLAAAPWGVEAANNLVRRDEFVVAMARAAFGPIESRPVLFQADAYRFAQAAIWHRVYNLVPADCEGPGIFVFSHYEYITEEELRIRGENFGTSRSRPKSHVFRTGDHNDLGNFFLQRVSDATPWTPQVSWVPSDLQSLTDCNGITRWNRGDSFIAQPIFRGEFSTSAETYTAPVFHVHARDYWSYVSANVWELYIFDLLSRGILDYRELFKLYNGEREDITVRDILNNMPRFQLGIQGDRFGINHYITEELRREFQQYGVSVHSDSRDESDQYEVSEQVGTLTFPAFAPELGVVQGLDSRSIRDLNFNVLTYSDFLGRNYRIEQNGIFPILTDPDLTQGVILPEQEFFRDSNMTVMSALRIIERVLRQTEADMSELEANIINYQFGARMIDIVYESDQSTVSFLIAKGILDFENIEEFRNLYSSLTRDFAFTLIYRLANPQGRTNFSQVLITVPEDFQMTTGSRMYQNQMLTHRPGTFDRFISLNPGRLVHNPHSENPIELSIRSSVFVEHVHRSTLPDRANYVVTLNIDNPLRYLYRGFPLVLHTFSFSERRDELDSMTPLDVPPGARIQRPRTSPEDSAEMFIAYNPSWGGPGFLENHDVTFFRPHPENRQGAHSREVLDRQEGILQPDGSRIGGSIDDMIAGAPFVNDPRLLYYPSTDEAGGETSGVSFISTHPTLENRYLVQISIPAPNPTIAVDFVRQNLVSLTEGLFTDGGERNQVDTRVTNATGSLMVRTDSVLVPNQTVISGNIMTSQNNLIISNNTYTLANRHVVGGTQSNAVGMNMDSLMALNNNIARDTLGFTDLMLVNSPLLNQPNVRYVQGQSRGTIHSRVFTTQDHGDVRAINLTTSGLSDIFSQTVSTTVTVPSDGSAREVHQAEVHIVLELTPIFPTAAEQAILQRDIHLEPQHSDLNLWFFTRPDSIPELATLWDYNIGVTRAIVQAMGMPPEVIQSGFLVPTLTFLVDQVESFIPVPEGQLHHNARNIAYAQDHFLHQVGSFIDARWITRFIGHHTVFSEPSQFLAVQYAGLLGSDVIQQSDSGFLFTPPQGAIPVSSVTESTMPLWASLYFDHTPLPGTPTTEFFHTRLHLPSLQSRLILEFDGATRIFGEREYFAGDEEEASAIRPDFFIDDFNNIYINASHTHYRWIPETQAFIFNFPGANPQPLDGRRINWAGYEWTIARDTGSELFMVGNVAIPLEVHGGTLLSREGLNIEDTNALFVVALVEGQTPSGINPIQTVSFMPFDTLNVGGWGESGFLVADFVNGQVVVNELVPLLGGSYIRQPISVSEGQQIHFRPIVRLNRSVWNPDGTLNNVIWRPSILGADPGRYNPSHNIDIARSFTIPVDSENLVTLEEFQDLNFYVGELQAHRRNGVNTIVVPWSPQFLDTQHNIAVESLTNALHNASVPVFTGTRAASAVDYLSVNGIKEWDPDFPYYMNTLVMFNGELHVVTGNGLPVPFTPSATVFGVALKTSFLEGLRLEVIRDYVGAIIRAQVSNRQEREPTLNFHRRTYENLRIAISSGLPVSIGNLAFVEFQHAMSYHEVMIRTFNLQEVRRNIGMIGWTIVILALFFSTAIILVRSLSKVGLVTTISMAFLDHTGFDILAILTLRVVRTGEEPPGWLATIFLASAVGFIPLVIIGLFAGNGISIL